MKPGYKNTEIGVIPEDWEVKTLGELGEAFIGLTYDPKDLRSDGTIVLRSSNIIDGRIDLNDAVYVRSDLKFSEDIYVRDGDILICARNGSRSLIGKCALIDNECAGMTFGAFMAIYRSSIHKYLFFVFSSTLMRRQIDENLGATINQITNQNLKSFLVPLPPLPEQRAIASALSDIDALLSSLDRLIAKKRDIKTAAMQALLSGKQRLPGFAGTDGYKNTEIGVIPEDWEIKTLGEVVNFLDGARRPIKENERAKIKGDIPYYGATGIVDYVNDYIFDEELILLGEDGENILSRVLPLAFKIKGKSWVNNHAHVLKVKEINPDYLLFFLNYTNYEQYNTGTAQPKLNKAVCSKIPIPVPPIDEQRAIAQVLSDMDAEIEALEAQRDKTALIKQGMMQELLTGKTRLV